VLTADVRFEGWNTESWTRFLSLWEPRAAPEREPNRPRGGIIAVHDGKRLRKLVSTRTGRLDPSRPWPLPPAELASEHGASWVLSGHLGALDEVMERFGARSQRGDDLTRQALVLVELVRDMLDEGALESWPRRLKGVPVPTVQMIERAVGSVCADGHAILLGLFQGDSLWTSFLARRRGMLFDCVIGPEELRDAMGPLSGEWRRDYRHLVGLVEDHYAPLSLGCFAEVTTFRELLHDPRPGAWSRAVTVRDVALSPVPAGIGLALGVDGARYAFDHLKAATARFGGPAGPLFARFDPLMAKMRSRLGDVVGDKDVSTSLGFDPLAVLRALLKR
jgi:hypothetical protein